jgi:terminase large subunit-like protein
MTLDDILARLGALPQREQQEIKDEALKVTAARYFVPNVGPQTEAYFSGADEVFYGGGAGGGKSALLCGLAIEEHHKAIIFRREFPQIKSLVDEVQRQIGSRAGYSAENKVWRLPKGNELEFGSVAREDDKEKYQGRAHDLKGFDEITHFSESQYRFLIAWNRSTEQGQRCRVVATGNPPISAEGTWVIKYWGPWLDPTHPNPAKPGELRWFAVVDGKDVEVAGPSEHARSRTFIPARLEDNPDLLKTGYAAVIEGMPEPLRSMMREGRFDVGQSDVEFQVIPTAWIVAAQERWTPDGFRDFSMTAMAFDPAGGGEDAAELAYRHGGWYGALITERGVATADGNAAAATIFRHRRDNAPVIIDVGGGYGGAVTLRLRDNGVLNIGFNGAAASSHKTFDKQLGFTNKRAEAWWRFREALDPDQQGGSAICLPPDPELRADLAAPTYSVGPRGIVIESKDELRKRLGRSPGKGDAVVMCLSEGNTAQRKLLRSFQAQQTTANMGYATLKRR